MNATKKILTKLNGLHYPQEYLCFGAESFSPQLRAYLVQEGKIRKDITTLHAFVGYCPVVFAFPALEEFSNSETIEVAFSHEGLDRCGEWNQKHFVAQLAMKKIKTQTTGNAAIAYYEGVQGRHHFIPAFHQSIGQLYNRLYNKRPGNVFLEGNLYKQVQIAYALPRKICLITVEIAGCYNLFPTDLHGQVTEEHYIISLRHTGKACEQVLAVQNIVLSDMQAGAYSKTYCLGKNHMQPLKEITQFDFSSAFSSTFLLPLPNQITGYKELQLQDSFNAGIHKLLLFKIINTEQLASEANTLAHVHNAYATWRRKKDLPGNYLLR